jgi:sterol-4alpha-carboxylate 3-dehydrogenase (decarboxylating)
MEMMKLLHTPRTWFQIGPNALVHDWVYVDSCAQAHVLAAKALLRSPAGPNGESERADGQAFNISDGAPMPFWDFPRKLWREAGDANWAPDGPHRVIQIPFWVVLFAVALLEWVYWVCTLGLRRPGSSSQTFAYMKTGCWLDIGKARRVLGYEPLCGTEEGIRRTVEWLRDNGFLDDKRKLE